MSRALLLLVCSVALSFPIDAQASWPRTYQGVAPGEIHRIPWPSGIGGAGPFERALAGRITGHDERSAIVTKDGIATLVYRPTHFEAFWEVSKTRFVDVAILMDPDEDDQDALLGSSPAGLHRIEFDPATGTFVPEIIGGGQWRDATRIVTVDLDDDGHQEVIGLDATNHNVLILSWRETEGTVEERSFPVGPGCRDLVALDWDGDSRKEIAVLRASEIVIYPQTGGSPQGDIRMLAPGGSIVALPTPNRHDHLGVLLRNPPNTTDWLYTFQSDDYLGPKSMQFSPPSGGTAAPVDSFALLTGDWNGDKSLDLLPAHDAFLQGIVMTNKGTPNAPTFDPDGAGDLRIDLSVNAGGSAAGNRGVPLFSDLDSDTLGTDDVLFPLESPPSLIVQASEPQLLPNPGFNTNPGTNQAFFGGGGPPHGIFATTSDYVQSASFGELDLRLQDLPGQVMQFSHVQVTVWSQDDPVTPSSPPPTDRMAIYNKIHPLSDDSLSPGNHSVPIVLPVGGTPCIGCTSGYLWPDRGHLYLLVRFVNVTPWGNGYRVVQGTDPHALGMTLPATQAEKEHPVPATNPAYAYLLATGEAGELIPLEDPLNARAGVGAIVPRNTIPPFAVPGIPGTEDLTQGDSTDIWFP